MLTSMKLILRSRSLLLVVFYLSFISLILGKGPSSQSSIKEFQSFIDKSATKQNLKSLAQKIFSFEMDAKEFDDVSPYVDLQKVISEKIRHEYSRPVINLKIYWGDRTQITSKNTIGILGGMGPLSDANLIKLIVTTLKKYKRIHSGPLMIHLFSLPPPRTLLEQMGGGVSYALRLRQFLRYGYRKYYLASNTAYVYYKTIKILSGVDNIFYLPKVVITTIKNKSVDTVKRSILIVGSTLAWEKRLYDNLILSNDLLIHRLEEKEQDSIQSWIQKTKEGLFNDYQSDLLFKFIVQLAQKYDTKNILLSCTELSLALSSRVHLFENLEYTVFDSEQLFVDLIVSFILDYFSMHRVSTLGRERNKYISIVSLNILYV